jgi:hypothetical protein
MTTETTKRTEAAGNMFHGDSVFHLQEVKNENMLCRNMSQSAHGTWGEAFPFSITGCGQ